MAWLAWLASRGLRGARAGLCVASRLNSNANAIRVQIELLLPCVTGERRAAANQGADGEPEELRGGPLRACEDRRGRRRARMQIGGFGWYMAMGDGHRTGGRASWGRRGRWIVCIAGPRARAGPVVRGQARGGGQGRAWEVGQRIVLSAHG